MTVSVRDVVSKRRTRIVATLGPASRESAAIAALVRAGVDVFRLNFSHGTHDEHRVAFTRVRAAAEQAGRPIAVLADLCGPKIRVGHFPGGGIDLVAGQEVIVTTRDVPGSPKLIAATYPDLARDVRPGNRILMDDGLLELRVERATDTEIVCVVVVGGRLGDRKGINLPGVAVSAPALTEQDRDDASFALKLGVDYFALSFVRQGKDVTDLKSLLREEGAVVPIIAKIEKPEALANIDAILDAADGVMVARGDLGVEMPPEQVPIVQRDLVARARRSGKPVIVATQMLESMVHNPRPTRAEVSDVSGAVFSGADAVMLSAETAIGVYSAPAVAVMDRVAREVEARLATEGSFGNLTDDESSSPPLPVRKAVAKSTAQLSRDLQVRAIAVRTRNGRSAQIVAATRPAAPILALTTDQAVARRINLLWGVIPCSVSAADYNHPEDTARNLSRNLGLSGDGQYILLVGGFGKGHPAVTVLPI